MKKELIFHVVLEPHYYVVPNCAESVLTLPHFIHHTSVHMRVEVPTLNVRQVASFDWNSDADWNYLPGLVVCWVC
jgi:hypothetical protein